MANPGKLVTICLLAISFVAGGAGLRAEVSADTHRAVYLLILGITEGPDPIPQIWEPVRQVAPELILNASGAKREDGRPDAAHHPETQYPHVVWAYDAGQDHDIAYSHWHGDGWTDAEFLTGFVSDELDPRIHIDVDGTIYVVWWEASPEQVWMSMRVAELATWEIPEAVTGMIDAGRRPSVVVSNDMILTAYERDAAEAGQEIVVATRVGAGVYDSTVIAATQSNKALNVILHEEDGKLWVDWRHSDTEFAYSVFRDESWSELATIEWMDDSWARVEEVRRLIRGVVAAE